MEQWKHDMISNLFPNDQQSLNIEYGLEIKYNNIPSKLYSSKNFELDDYLRAICVMYIENEILDCMDFIEECNSMFSIDKMGSKYEYDLFPFGRKFNNSYGRELLLQLKLSEE